MLVAPVSIEVMVEHNVITTLTTSLQRPYISTIHIINHAQTVLSKEILNQMVLFLAEKGHVSLDLDLISIYK